MRNERNPNIAFRIWQTVKRLIRRTIRANRVVIGNSTSNPVNHMTIPIPHYKISYAQNFEDLLLSGVFRNIENGFYVDVGANHPVHDSVTKVFYDRGWSGINVEPNPKLHAELSQQRPRDVNLMLGLASQPGSLAFRSYDAFDGMSSFSRDARENISLMYPNATYTDSHVEISSLSQILLAHRPSGEIHFLKIDVEGMELEVLLGNSWKHYRPWMLCIEQTQDTARRSAISKFLEEYSYTNVFFDGINDFHVASEKRDIWDDFSYPRDVIMNGVPVNHIFIKCIVDMTNAQQALLEQLTRAA